MPHSFALWPRLESQFNYASLARAMDLKRLLVNLDKSEAQPMDDFLMVSKTLQIHLLLFHLQFLPWI